MRISDWSSDVCSSDLRRRLDNVALRLHRGDLDDGTAEIALQHLQAAVRRERLGKRRQHLLVVAAPGRRLPQHAAVAGQPRLLPVVAEALDRTSVVSGKSVSVRVDLGGRRSIKKKQQTAE